MNLIVIEPPFFNIGVDPSLPPIRILRKGQNHYIALIAAALYIPPIRTVNTPRARDAARDAAPPRTPVIPQLPPVATPTQSTQPQVLCVVPIQTVNTLRAPDTARPQTPLCLYVM